ncbi:fasciclin-like arabinogalactan protein 4 [Miscanthus floridulus]|uniref:fasciclin-like arabinogalactan protein 4 n=1 Tax=Miscanthus floridulus TaxID=154761 RepID=UPI00345808AA
MGNLPQWLSSFAFVAASGADLADVLRFHVLLEFLAPADIRRLPASVKIVTTLFQTTSRAPVDLGAVNITTVGSSLAVVRLLAPSPDSNATVLNAITAVLYNLSVLAVNGLTASDGPSSTCPRPSTSPVSSPTHAPSAWRRPCSRTR